MLIGIAAMTLELWSGLLADHQKEDRRFIMTPADGEVSRMKPITRV